MILKEQLNAEIKIGKIVKKDDIFIIEEYKDGNLIEETSLDELVDKYLDKEYVRIRFDFLKEI